MCDHCRKRSIACVKDENTNACNACVKKGTGFTCTTLAGAMCVEIFDDSLNSAIHITYRISLRSSSMPEPRDPLLKVLMMAGMDPAVPAPVPAPVLALVASRNANRCQSPS
jgi:hypothetical protein